MQAYRNSFQRKILLVSGIYIIYNRVDSKRKFLNPQQEAEEHVVYIAFLIS